MRPAVGRGDTHVVTIGKHGWSCTCGVSGDGSGASQAAVAALAEGHVAQHNGGSAVELQPLLDRSRYTDEEWAFASSGRCDWETATYPHLTRCGKPSSPNSSYRYCDEHDEEARESPGYGR
jgi:hypothetical protein